MKKIISLTLILVIMMILVTSVNAASSCKLVLRSSKKELEKGDEFTITVKLSDINDEKGIVALGGTLKYDKESLELVEMKGKGWSDPTYNERNDKFVTDRNNGYATSNEDIFTITFKVKDESKQKLEIGLSNISASNGNEDIKINDISTIVSVNDIITPPKENENEDKPSIIENTNNENETSNNAQNNNQSFVGKDMPDTGSSNIIVVFIAIATVATIVSFVKMKKIEERM